MGHTITEESASLMTPQEIELLQRIVQQQILVHQPMGTLQTN
ncbi:hypothetical protein [Epilithonimonas hominis]|nr:hypothetical protein [Epilithonimonas hominis]